MSIERRTTGSGETRWDVRLRRPDGTAYKRTFRTRRDAEKYEASELTDRARGNWIDPQAGRITLADWADEWFEANQHRWRPNTIDRNKLALAHWTKRVGHIELNSIAPRQVQRVVNDFAARYQPLTVRGYYFTFRTMLADAVEMDVIGRSPCRAIRLPPAKAKEKRVITPDELHRLADAIGPDWRSMIYLAGVMGLRYGEVAALSLGAVDLTIGQLAVSRTLVEAGGRLDIGQPKTAAGNRTLDLPQPLVAEIQQHIERHQLQGQDRLLFANHRGGPLRKSNFLRRQFGPAVKEAGVEGLTFHGLRHSAATIWMAAGADAKTVQRLLGHSDPRLVLKLYAHGTDESIRRGGELATRFYWDDSDRKPSQDRRDGGPVDTDAQ